MIADVVEPLRAEAVAANERRLLVLTGSHEACLDAAATAIDAMGISREAAPLVGDRDVPGFDRIAQPHAGQLLGTTTDAVIFDAHAGLTPNALGRVVGTVDGGGLLLLCCPPLDGWPDRRDPFDETLAVPPFPVDDVTGHFRRRFVRTLRAHDGIAIVAVDDGCVERNGLTEPAPHTGPAEISLPDEPTFPRAAYESCLTADQVAALHAFEALLAPETALVLEADRGRGKSSVAGLAAACLALTGDEVIITAPAYRSAREAFLRASELLGQLDEPSTAAADPPRRLETHTGGEIEFQRPAAVDPDFTDVLIVDEAAAIGVPLLADFLAADRVAFTTTIHGYEGTGRGFAVRFRDRLAASDHSVSERTLTEPIRYAAGDPIEVWSFRALLLNAAPAVDQVVDEADPETASYVALEPVELLEDESLLREAFGLLVLAHYRTEPDDLARLLDAPNIAVRALRHNGHVASVALLAHEGNLSADRRARMYEGGRIRGNMLPDVLTSQLRDEDAGSSAGLRIMRIATHPAIRSRGLGSALLDSIHEEFQTEVDWFGVGYGATPRLVSFWRENGYGTVHCSTTRNDVSGEHSALMLRPVTDAGQVLHHRHANWFAERVGSMLSGPLSNLDPDIVRAVLYGTDATVEPELDDTAWRLVAGAAYGPGIIDVDLRPFRALAVSHLIDPTDADALSPRAERLLVAKVLQGRSWRTVTTMLGFHSTGECMRAIGEAYQPFVDAADASAAQAEADRYRE